MDPLDKLNRSVAEIVGPSYGAIPRYVDDWAAAWQLIRYSHTKQTEFSLFMMIYDTHPIFMASFIRGMSQRTSTGDDPMLAICKAFVMMFGASDEPYH